jgi:hypothetical protein
MSVNVHVEYCGSFAADGADSIRPPLVISVSFCPLLLAVQGWCFGSIIVCSPFLLFWPLEHSSVK